MKITVLIENTAPEGLTAEWGLSLHIEHEGKRYLLDAGSSDAFAANARALGINLEDVDAVVLSHAHFDHSGGLDAFCAANDRAPVYIRSSAAENCYSWHRRFPKYIGVQKGVLKKWQSRFVRAEGDFVIEPGVTLLGHRDDNLRAKGKAAQMYVRKGLLLLPDEFKHEQSLVFEVNGGIVIFSSCSHSGVDSILDEITHAYPNKPIHAMIGGFHLVRTPPREVRLLAERLKKMGAPQLYTGHCTGDAAMSILAEVLPDRVHCMTTGMRFEIGEDET